MREHRTKRRFPGKTAFLLLVIFSVYWLSSCTPVKRQMPAISRPRSASPQQRTTTTHIVAPGETLWRISKMYSVPIATIMNTNHLSDKNTLLMGQELIIPQGTAAQPIISLYPNDKWQYIIIHHSATDEGSSLDFHKYHLSKGWDQGVGYHFVIDNGKSGKADGLIETTPRWLKQLDGAHCKASDMNTKAIGICLVGNFNDEDVTKAQLKSLVYLVKELKEYYKIPTSLILGHRDVAGSKTDCPGQYFPWRNFKSLL